MIEVNIRDIQHYRYCPHRWGLIKIGNVWSENVFVTRGNIIHDKAHDNNIITYAKDNRTIRGVTVYDDILGIMGVLDCLEVKTRDGKIVSLTIVEYKPTMPQNANYNVDDALQVYAQRKCVISCFGITPQCVIYYAQQKKRVAIPFDEQLDYYESMLLDTLASIRRCINEATIPPISDSQHCGGCSLIDVCMPKSGGGKGTKWNVLNSEVFYAKTT